MMVGFEALREGAWLPISPRYVVAGDIIRVNVEPSLWYLVEKNAEPGVGESVRLEAKRMDGVETTWVLYSNLDGGRECERGTERTGEQA